MNLYRVQYFLITARTTEVVRQHEFHHRFGVEKTAFVVAESPEAAGAFIAGKHDCEIMSSNHHLGPVEVAPAEKEKDVTDVTREAPVSPIALVKGDKQ